MARDWTPEASKLWPVLTGAAKKRRSFTYTSAGARIGVYRRSMRQPLSYIQNFCLEKNLPRLTALVVLKSTGLPGVGFAGDVDKIEKYYEKIFRFDWTQIENPFGKPVQEGKKIDFYARLLLGQTKPSKQRMQKIPARSRQPAFRQALLDAYHCRCAMCGIGLEEVLEAAHIVPWKDCKDEPICMDVTNGVLLCANHHKLFDSGRVYFNDKYRIRVDYMERKHGHAESDKQASVALSGRKLYLPDDKRHHPNKKFLKRRNENI